MTNELAREFADCASFEDCVAKLHGAFYFCYGLTWDKDENTYSLRIDRYKSLYPQWEFDEEILNVTSRDRCECMNHFFEDAIWVGMTFWDAAPDMEWTDYEGV